MTDRAPPEPGFELCDRCRWYAVGPAPACPMCGGAGHVRVGAAVVRRPFACPTDTAAITFSGRREVGSVSNWECLAIVPSGFVRCEWRRAGTQRVVTGNVDRVRAAILFRQLDACRFPLIPSHAAPLCSARTIRIDYALPVIAKEATFDPVFVASLPGYHDLMTSLVELELALLRGEPSVAEAWGFRAWVSREDILDDVPPPAADGPS